MSARDLIKPVRITRHNVYIGGVELPGAIEEDSVTFRPGGYKTFNRLTVTFIVGELEAVDPHAEEDRINEMKGGDQDDSQERQQEQLRFTDTG